MICTHLSAPIQKITPEPGAETLIVFQAADGCMDRALMPDWATPAFQAAAQENGGHLDLSVRNEWMLIAYRSPAGEVNLLDEHARRNSA